MDNIVILSLYHSKHAPYLISTGSLILGELYLLEWLKVNNDRRLLPIVKLFALSWLMDVPYKIGVIY